MNNEKFLKELNRDLKVSKEELLNKSQEVVKDLNDYKTYLEEELKREKNKYNDKAVIDSDYKEIVKYDDEIGILDFDEMDEDGYEALATVASNDPTFALSFLERRKSEIPEGRYDELKEKILKKMF